MNELINKVVTPRVTTMSSLEMVEFINSQRTQGEAELLHKHFLAKVPQVLGVETSAKFSANLPDAYGRDRRGYNFPKREACLMAMSYSYELQAKVFDRMTELEERKVAPQVPQSLPEALRLAADLAEQNAQQAVLIEKQKPAVEFVQKYAEAESTKCLGDVAKLLGFKPQEFPKVLAADKVIFKRNSVWVPTQAHGFYSGSP